MSKLLGNAVKNIGGRKFALIILFILSSYVFGWVAMTYEYELLSVAAVVGAVAAGVWRFFESNVAAQRVNGGS